jgi:hypothetical protein
VSKLSPCEISEVNLVPGMIRKQYQHGQHDKPDEKFAEIGAHSPGEPNRTLSVCQEKSLRMKRLRSWEMLQDCDPP